MAYARLAQAYYESGWQGALPLPRAKKFPPPSGFTGKGSPYPDLAKIAEWIDENPNGNVALRLPVNVLGIDIDHGYAYDKGVKNGLDSFQSLLDQLGPLPTTWVSTSRLNGEAQGSGIRLYRVPADKQWREKSAGGDIELISANHRYIVAWPSTHPDTGQTYRWVKPDGTVAEDEWPAIDELPELPESWVNHLSQALKPATAFELPAAGPSELDKLLEQLDDLGSEGDGRNNDLNRLAWRIGQLIPGGLIDEKTAREHLWNAAVAAGLVAEDGEGKVNATITSGLNSGISDPRRVSLINQRKCSDIGNADRFADRHAGDAVYVPEWGGWFTWNGSIWSPNEAAVWRMAEDTAKAISREISQTSDEQRRAELMKHYKSSQYRGSLNSMIELAKNRHVFAKRAEDFDREKHIFNAGNVIVNLMTGETTPHNADAWLTKISPINYDPDAQAPEFELFLKQIFDGNEELISYVQRIAGYSLTGDVSERKMFVLWGGGANGKSTLLEIILALTGRYGAVTDAELLLSKQGGNNLPQLAALQGKRMVACSETDFSRAFAEAQVKSITGAETIAARKLYSDPFEYKPEFKLWLATNYRPRVRGGDDGIWSRIALVPFNVKIPEGQRKKNLADKLIYNEGSGILAWAVRGAMEWYATEDLGTPDAVKSAVKEYRESEDTFGQFLDEHLVKKPGSKVGARTAMSLYNDWCRLHNEKPWGTQTFSRVMQERGYNKKRLTDGVFYIDVAVKVSQ